MCRRKPIPFTLEQNFLSRLPKLRAKRDGSSRRPPCGTAAPAGRSCLDSRGHSFVCGPAQGRGPPSRYLRVGLPPCPVGEAVLATYRQVRLLEGSLEDRLRDLREDTEGTIRLGMHIVRARILVPPAAARFCREFPHVRLEVVHGDTAVLEDKLGQGDAAPVPGCRFGGASPLLLHAGGLGDSLSRDCRGPAGPLLPSRGRGGYH